MWSRRTELERNRSSGKRNIKRYYELISGMYHPCQWERLCVCPCPSVCICVMNAGHCSTLVKHITDITIPFCLFCIIFSERQIDSDWQNHWKFDGKLTFRHYTKSKESRADTTLTFDMLMCQGMHLTHSLHATTEWRRRRHWIHNDILVDASDASIVFEKYLHMMCANWFSSYESNRLCIDNHLEHRILHRNLVATIHGILQATI